MAAVETPGGQRAEVGNFRVILGTFGHLGQAVQVRRARTGGLADAAIDDVDVLECDVAHGMIGQADDGGGEQRGAAMMLAAGNARELREAVRRPIRDPRGEVADDNAVQGADVAMDVAVAQAHEERIVAVGDGDVGDTDVLHFAAVHDFERDGGDVGVVDVQVAADDVFESAVRGGAEFQAVATGTQPAVFHQHVVAGLVLGFEADGVVLGIEIAAAHDGMHAAIHIHAVVVICGEAADGDVLEGELLAVLVILHPAGAVPEGDVAHGDVGAIAEIDDDGALAFLGVGQGSLLGEALGIGGEGGPLPIYRALPADADVLLLIGEHEAVEIDHAIIRVVGAAEQSGVFLQAQGDVAFEIERSTEIAARREDHGAAAGGGRGVNGLL